MIDARRGMKIVYYHYWDTQVPAINIARPRFVLSSLLELVSMAGANSAIYVGQLRYLT